jgi:hypothetical protein
LVDNEIYYKQFRDLISARAQGNAKAGEDFLTREFFQRNGQYHGLDKDYLRNLFYCLEKRQDSYANNDEIFDSLINHSKDLDPLSLPCEKWLALFYICIRHGMLRNAYFLREKARDCIFLIAQETNNSHDLVKAFRASINEGDFTHAYQFLNNVKENDPDSLFSKELEAYNNLLTGNKVEFQKEKAIQFTSIDKKFWNLIKDKTVAVVGPAPSGQPYGDEIDSFEIVIRMGYMGPESMPDRSEFGKTVNVSYYGEAISEKIDIINTDFLNKLDFSVFKTTKYCFQKDLIRREKGRISMKNSNFFYGSPLEANRILYDLLHFQPHKIKLFKSNFYHSNNIYYAGFKPEIFSLNKIFYGFAHHDILSNLNFTRIIRNNGLIEADRDCHNVLDLNSFDYCASMEKIIGNAMKTN